MSRKFDRRKQIEIEAARQLDFIAKRLFKPKPRWMPKVVWKLLLGLIIRQ